MSGAIIENNDGSEIIVEGRNGANTISLQTYQDIYNQITGRSEEVTKISKKSIKVVLEDIRQLDLKIHQILEQFNVRSFNSSFTTYFDQNQKDVHSSIERLLSSNTSSNCCTDSIAIKYNFLITLPKATNPQNYVVNVRIINRLVNQRKILAELPIGAPKSIAGMFATKTFEAKIEYVDYAVARTIMSAIDEWHDALDESNESKFIHFAKRVSHFIPPLFKYVSLLVASATLINYLPNLSDEKQDFVGIATLSVYGFLFLFFSYKIGNTLGHFVEQSIDSANEISYVKFTRGDEKLVVDSCTENKLAYVKATVGTIFTTLLNVVAKYWGARFFLN